MNKLQLINEEEVIIQDGIVYMNTESIGRALGYTSPKDAIFKIYQRHQDELDNYSVKVKMTSTDGKSYNQRLFTEEGIYIISMLANTDKAKVFRAELAKFLKQKRLEALHKERMAGYEISERLNKRYRNLKLSTADIEMMKTLLSIHFPKRGIAKTLNISEKSVRRIEKVKEMLQEII